MIISYPSHTYTKEITIRRSEATIYELLAELEKIPKYFGGIPPKKMETLLRIKGKNKKELCEPYNT